MGKDLGKDFGIKDLAKDLVKRSRTATSFDSKI